MMDHPPQNLFLITCLVAASHVTIISSFI